MAFLMAQDRSTELYQARVSSWGPFAMRREDAPGDLHFHDADEYWLITGGRARVRCGDEEREMGRGDLLYAKMGELHHTIEVLSEEPFQGVYLEMALRGKKRPGHLHVGVHPLPTEQEMAE
ncbi:cupin domain-containing protein [Candidatus Poribacteria bacterium]|nr:cupin domain-containing protein [Candidatus Poribacteria bacterium]